MSGILGGFFDPEVIAARDRLGRVGDPHALVVGMTDDQRDNLAAAALGVDRDAYDLLGRYVCAHLSDEIRRDTVRERVWQIEADIVARFPEDIAAEIDRAVAPPQSETTQKQYAVDQRHFAMFCAAFGVPAMPADAPVLAAYILDGGMNWPLLRRRLTAIADWHRKSGRVMPKAHPLVRVAIRHAMKKIETEKETSNGQTTGA